MATSSAISVPVQSGFLGFAAFDSNRRDTLGLVLSICLPLSVFVIANGLAELNGVLPLFFAPFALPGWLGAALHIGSLPLFGVARWMVAGRGSAGRRAGWWLVALMAGTIGFPFVVFLLDSFALAVLSMLLLLVGLSTVVRVAQISPRAALIMAPGLAWMGLSAFIGLSLAAGWTPPFSLTNAQGQATQ